MQRAKEHAGHNSPAKRRKVAVSSPKTVPTRKPPTPIKEEEDDYDDDSAPAQPAPKQAKASDSTVAPTPKPQGDDEEEEEEEEEGGGARAILAPPPLATRASPRLLARAASARTEQANVSEPESESETESSASELNIPRPSDRWNDDKWVANSIVDSLASKPLMLDALYQVIKDIPQAAGAYRKPTADNESTYDAKNASVPAENPDAVHRLVLLLYKITKEFQQRREQGEERAEPLLGAAKANVPEQHVEPRIKRALSFIMDGAYSKGTRALGSNGMADLDDDAVRASIELLYPRADGAKASGSPFVV